MKDPDPRVESRRIDEFESEFPQCDPRYAGQSYRGASNTVTSTEDATFLFEDIPAGTYAISVFHDLDDDGKLATNFIGFPKEPYGFSGGHGKYGPPDFEKASFVVGEEALSIEVELK